MVDQYLKKGSKSWLLDLYWPLARSVLSSVCTNVTIFVWTGMGLVQTNIWTLFGILWIHLNFSFTYYCNIYFVQKMKVKLSDILATFTWDFSVFYELLPFLFLFLLQHIANATCPWTNTICLRYAFLFLHSLSMW